MFFDVQKGGLDKFLRTSILHNYNAEKLLANWKEIVKWINGKGFFSLLN